eukprot:3021664-Rhodomonas_salina.1
MLGRRCHLRAMLMSTALDVTHAWQQHRDTLHQTQDTTTKPTRDGKTKVRLPGIEVARRVCFLQKRAEKGSRACLRPRKGGKIRGESSRDDARESDLKEDSEDCTLRCCRERRG